MVSAAHGGGGGSTPTVPFFPGLSGMISGLIEIVMDQKAIDDINKHLETAKTSLKEAEGHMSAIAASGVGGSWWGSQLSHHSGLANSALLDTLNDTKTGLDHFATSMELAMKKVSTADEDAEVEARQGLNCVTPDATTNPGCVP